MSQLECPCCGEVGEKHLVQKVHGDLLKALWRVQFGVDTGKIPTPGLYECGCGLRFFHPATAGDSEFYRSAYQSGAFRKWLNRPATDRADFLEAAKFLKPGDRVLDVGGHRGSFAQLMPSGAECVVIDPYAEEYAADGILRETAAQHAKTHPGHYDVVSAFHVLEHVESPRDFVVDLLACLRPGGLLLLATPTWPSVVTEIPNMAMNAPPHHLAWWCPGAYRAFAKRMGLEFVQAENIAGTAALRSVWFWLWRLTPSMPPNRPFRHSWYLHFRLAMAALLQKPCNFLFGPGPEGIGTDVVFAARKPVE